MHTGSHLHPVKNIKERLQKANKEHKLTGAVDHCYNSTERTRKVPSTLLILYDTECQ